MKLKYPTLPLIVERCQPKNNLYPIEVLIVCENQRVSKGQQTSSQVQTMIRVSMGYFVFALIPTVLSEFNNCVKSVWFPKFGQFFRL